MAGIYIHIPFCRQACHYCNFHFSTSSRLRPEVVQAIVMEMTLRREFLQEPAQSIYFGGGTPSLLTTAEFEQLFEALYKNFRIDPKAEITLEANPDDLDAAKVAALRKLPINRFSIGIQSFQEEHLKWMNRAHSASEALTSVKRVQQAGFDNISIDLIYGLPQMSSEVWAENIRTALDLGVPHISSYCLTVEPRTALGKKVETGQQKPVDEEQAEKHFFLLSEMTAAAGLEQYEVSNFARKGYHSRHNSSYWTGAHYLGLGPSAHSFNGNSRSWNVANNARYVRALQAGQPFCESEIIDLPTAYNEYIMTGLRTSRGVDLCEIKTKFGRDLNSEFPERIKTLLAEKLATLHHNRLQLTRRGFWFADGIASDLFWV